MRAEFLSIILIQISNVFVLIQNPPTVLKFEGSVVLTDINTMDRDSGRLSCWNSEVMTVLIVEGEAQYTMK